MPFDVATLAQDGVAVIVAAMATDAWWQVRERLGRLLGRGGSGEERGALAELDEMHAAVNTTSTQEATDEARVEFRGQLKTRLRQDPELAALFDAFIKELSAHFPATSTTATTVTQTAHADRSGKVIQAGRDITA